MDHHETCFVPFSFASALFVNTRYSNFAGPVAGPPERIWEVYDGGVSPFAWTNVSYTVEPANKLTTLYRLKSKALLAIALLLVGGFVFGGIVLSTNEDGNGTAQGSPN
jgi:hypothetical protein